MQSNKSFFFSVMELDVGDLFGDREAASVRGSDGENDSGSDTEEQQRNVWGNDTEQQQRNVWGDDTDGQGAAGVCMFVYVQYRDPYSEMLCFLTITAF